MRTALLYGLWAALCFVLTCLVVFALTEASAHLVVEMMTASLPVAAAMFGLASLGWALWHHRARRPGIVGYGLLAVAVTLAANFAFITLMLSNSSSDLNKFVHLSLVSLVLHGWFTIPVALVATWAFVRWQRRDIRKAQ